MEHLKNLGLGVFHSINYPAAGKLLYNCPGIWKEVAYSFFASGVLFLGSLGSYTYVIAPILSLLVPGLFEVLNPLYYLLWVFPIYILSFILNSFWYNDIANGAYK
jgi:hypothetical protein